MSTLDRLARKATTLTAADAEQIAAAVAAAVAEALAGHPKQDMPPAAPQGHRMRSLMRAMQPVAPVASKLSAPAPAPAATAHKELAAVAPRPPVWPIPSREIPITMRQNDLGRVVSFSMGDMEFRISRDGNGRISAAANSDGFGVRVTRRDANGHVAGLLMTPPTSR